METRTERIIRIRMQNPCMTLKAIGDATGVTKQRVAQVLSSHKLPTRAYVPHEKRVCMECGKEYTLNWEHHNPRFCGKECSYNYTHPTLICDMCGKEFRRYQRDILYARMGNKDGYFCSYQCSGKHKGITYGFVAHPGTRPPRIFDHDRIRALRSDGLTYREIAERVGCSQNTAWRIAH